MAAQEGLEMTVAEPYRPARVRYEARARTRFARSCSIRALWTACREKSKISRSSEERIIIRTIVGAKWEKCNEKNGKT